jgi:hypothetical protein
VKVVVSKPGRRLWAAQSSPLFLNERHSIRPHAT